MVKIIKSLWDNRKWLFSGLGVAILIIISNILINLYIKRESKIILNDQPSVSGTIVRNSEQALPDSTPRKTVSSKALTPQKIMETIKEAPLLQQSQVKSNYCGIKVHWAGTLSDAHTKDDSTIAIMMKPVGAFLLPCINFTVNVNNYPELRLLKDGDSLIVEGAIKEIDNLFIWLDEVRIQY